MIETTTDITICDDCHPNLNTERDISELEILKGKSMIRVAEDEALKRNNQKLKKRSPKKMNNSSQFQSQS
jgi:hypothetical protein